MFQNQSIIFAGDSNHVSVFDLVVGRRRADQGGCEAGKWAAGKLCTARHAAGSAREGQLVKFAPQDALTRGWVWAAACGGK